MPDSTADEMLLHTVFHAVVAVVEIPDQTPFSHVVKAVHAVVAAVWMPAQRSVKN